MHKGSMKLGDLGLSKQVLLTMTGAQKHTQCGSPLYLAPEVHMGQKYDKKVDVWGVGCVLFEMVPAPFSRLRFMLAPCTHGT